MEIWLRDLNEAPMGKFNMAADWTSKYIQIISKSIPKAQLEPLLEQAEHGFWAPGGLVLWHYRDLGSILLSVLGFHVPWDAPWCPYRGAPTWEDSPRPWPSKKLIFGHLAFPTGIQKAKNGRPALLLILSYGTATCGRGKSGRRCYKEGKL